MNQLENEHTDKIEDVYKSADKIDKQIDEIRIMLMEAKELARKYDNREKLKSFEIWIDNTIEALDFIVNDDFYGYYQRLKEGYAE